MTGQAASPPLPPELAALIDQVGPLDATAMAAARERLDALTKPLRSLGRLEELAVQLAGITGRPVPRFERRAILVTVADHGVASRGVSAYPQAVTAQMVANFLAGGAAINVLARHARADLVVVDLGVAGPIPSAGSTAPRSAHASDASSTVRFVSAPIRPGTSEFLAGSAMSRSEALAAIEVGRRLAVELVADGIQLIGLGEMGIGNTTSASALVAALTGEPAANVTGHGTGLDDDAYPRKVAVVEQALERHRLTADDPIGTLAAVGGFEIAGLVGAMLGAAAGSIPVLLDGFIVGAAALVASAICPALPPRLVASHRSLEPGHAVALRHLGLTPLLDLDLRLGEGTGAALAMGLVDAASAIRDEMATFESAGVSERTGE